MEDDNALDIIKWLFKESTNVDCTGILLREIDGVLSNWEAKLRGNLLAVKPSDIADVPQLFVCEKIQLHKDSTNPSAFYLRYDNEKLRFIAPSEAEAEKWLIKLATCSHQMIQADLDQLMQKYYTETTISTTELRKLDHNFYSTYFLTSPFEKDSRFYIYQSVGLPNRMVICKELMCESKLSLVVPPDMLKLSIGWAYQLRNDLLNSLRTVQNAAISESLHNAVRHLNSNIEVCTQGIEFLDAYVGPCFRPSLQRYRIAFAAVPTNLHVQYFQINGQPSARFLTCGATTVAPLRFTAGGLYRMQNKFLSSLDASALDSTNEYRFHARRKTLMNAKREIGDLTKRIDTDWHVAKFGTVDKVGVEIFAQLKQLHETVYDIIQSFPNIFNLADGLCTNGYAQMPAPNALPDTLSNQLDCLEASMISLSSKLAVIDAVNDDTKGRESFEESAKSALNSTLDVLLQIVDSVLIVQLISLVISLRRPADSQNFFSIQLRNDLLLSQAVTIISTALLTSVQELANTKKWENRHTLTHITAPLITCFSFLSCYGDERGMMEDMFETYSNFYNYVQFRYVEANSSVSQTCIPQIEGHRTDLQISIPLSSALYKILVGALGEKKSAEWFRVETIFWNIGVNHEATLACSLGDISLEENVNKTALTRLCNYVQKHYERLEAATSNAQVKLVATTASTSTASCASESNATSTTEKTQKSTADSGAKDEQCINDVRSIYLRLAELKETVNACPSRKNISIFTSVVALTNALNGSNVISCKSGKDRTAMALTLEEGRTLKETCGISQNQMFEIIECLRRDGVRRENCRKNIGKAIYSFSPFQMHFIPKELRPPNGTYSQLSS